MLKVFTFRRAWNYLVLRISYLFALLTKNPVIHGMPVSLAIEPACLCNLHCPECPLGENKLQRQTGIMNIETYKKIVDETASHCGYLLLYFQGEPYMNHSLFDMAAYAVKKRMYTVTSTNGHFLNEENIKKTIQSGLDKIIISVDGLSQDTYSKYRKGGDFQKVMYGIARLAALKKQFKVKKPFIELQFLVFRHNESEIRKVKKLKKQLNVNKVRLKSAQIYDFRDNEMLPPLQEKYSRYRQLENGSFTIKSRLPNRCWRMWSSCVITWDGRVVPCCFDKNADHETGNINDSQLKDIWRNKNYQTFRGKIFTSRKEIPVCRNCTSK